MKIFLILALILTQTARAELSLSDLGVNESKPVDATNELTKTEKVDRKSKLKTHEVLGLTTLGFMAATAFTGGSALDNNTHMYLGMATAGLYFTTAYYSLTAPKPLGVIDRGRIKWHKALAWVHFPLMLITPYLGYMYKKHEDEKKTHSSLEKQHTTAAGLLMGTFGLSAALMVVEF